MRSLAITLLLAASAPAASSTSTTKPDPFSSSSAQVVVLLFTRTDCPISNRYAPEVKRIYDRYSTQKVDFYLVYPDRDEKSEVIATHRKEFSYPMPPVQDPNHVLATRAKARITPEAAVFVRAKSDWRLVYHGRIDDRYVDFGKSRPAPTVHDLDDAIAAALAGKPPASAETKAIGCYISDLK